MPLVRLVTLTAMLLAVAPAWATDPEPLILNDATPEQLASLDGIDLDTAEEIVALIDERGDAFHSVEELRILPSVDAATLDALHRDTAVEITFANGTSKSYTSVEEVLGEFAHEPTVQQVQGWASDYARLNPGIVDRWLGASKAFALLPELTAEYRLADGWDQGFEYYPLDGTIDTPDDRDSVFDVLDDAGKDQDQRIMVRMRWDLDKLIMSSERIRVINESQDIVKLRDKVLTEVTRLYFERRRVQVEMLLKPKGDLLSQTKDHLRLMELTANLDALTGGTFTRALLR